MNNLEGTPPEKLNKEKLMLIIEEKIDKKIKEEGIDANEIAGIAENLKNKGLFLAGDELQEEAFKIYRQNLIDREFEKELEKK
ncbi:MAG: hypothetical protein AAB496_00215 [Patescibacteria group bacterium]